MRLLLISLILAISQLFCTKTSTEPPTKPTIPTIPKTDTLHYLALGDSYTIGESVTVEDRYPVQLINSLSLSTTTEKDLTIIARTGWTTDNLQVGISSKPDLRTEYDLVSLLIGVNNQYRGYPIDTYTIEFRELLEQSIGFAGGDTSRVFVVSIPDYAYTPFGNGDPNISQGIDDYNAINAAITAEYGINYFNITPISRKGLDEPELVASDGLHPSGEQYQRWVQLMLEDVNKMVTK